MPDLKAMYSTIRKDAFPETMTILLGDERLVYEKRVWTLDGEEKGLRYGENPDQPAALYALKEGSLSLGGLGLGLGPQLLPGGQHALLGRLGSAVSRDVSSCGHKKYLLSRALSYAQRGFLDNVSGK